MWDHKLARRFLTRLDQHAVARGRAKASNPRVLMAAECNEQCQHLTPRPARRGSLRLVAVLSFSASPSSPS